jgi:IclR family transcriptional regulator, acetate operon repressor
MSVLCIATAIRPVASRHPVGRAHRPDRLPGVSGTEAWHVGRTLRIIELLAFGGGGLSVPQLADALGAHPRTVRRVVRQLVEDEYVMVTDDGRRSIYAPTMRLVALAGQIVNDSPLVRRGRPYVALAQERTRATAHLMVPSYGSVICLAHCGAADEEARPRLHELVPAHCSAGGKVLLAWRDRWRASVLSRPLVPVTSRTLTDTRSLRSELDVVRRQGYATEDGELQPRARAVAAAVRASGNVVAALSVSGRRFDVAAATLRVIQLADELSADLAHG